MMFPRTCDARPSWNRPPENLARSQAVYAVTIGLRGKATTMLVRTTRVSVLASASAATVNGSWMVSGTCITSKPRASARCAQSATPLSGELAGQDAMTSMVPPVSFQHRPVPDAASTDLLVTRRVFGVIRARWSGSYGPARSEVHTYRHQVRSGPA
jgi:hypothetical protein